MSMSELLRPFGFGATKYRVMNVTKTKDKGSVAFYIDARDVMDRLDEVVGCENWQDKYTVLAFNDSRWAVECTLIVNGVAKTDVGEGDAPKDAYSDALKRAAVKFGVGRYLYDMDTGNWFPIDEWKNFTPDSKKQIDELLRRNLSRLGVESQPSALRKEPTTTTPPAGAVSTATGLQNGSTNGHGGQFEPRSVVEQAIVAAVNATHGDGWGNWTTADDNAAAYQWAKDSGKFGAERHLSNAWTLHLRTWRGKNAADALNAWREYVNTHEDAKPADVPAMAAVAEMAH
jgi:hypothetical protein